MRSASNNSFLMPIRITHDSTVVEKKHLTYFLFIWVKYPNGQNITGCALDWQAPKAFVFAAGYDLCDWEHILSAELTD